MKQARSAVRVSVVWLVLMMAPHLVTAQMPDQRPTAAIRSEKEAAAAAAAAALASLHENYNSDNDDYNDQCGLYLAMSSTSTAEQTTWGIYAGKDLAAGTTIRPAEIGLISHNLKANNYFAAYEESGENSQDSEAFLLRTVDFLEELIWVSASAGAKFEMTGGRATAAIPGAGALAAFDSKSTNTDWNVLKTYSRPGWGEVAGLSHPGRGANSNFFSAAVQTIKPVAAGSEIFLDYGENFSDEAQKDALTADDFKKLDQTVDQVLGFFEKHADSLKDDASKLAVYQFLTRDVMQAAVGTKKAQKIQSILPPRPADLVKVKEAGGMLRYSEPTVHRKISWLEQHGLCMDQIEPGPSTIPHAGRGAFATRDIPKGGLVAPVPLIHIPDERILDMHDITRSAQDGEYMRASDVVTGQQLLTNYVWGHPESSLVFLPVGPGVNFINHASGVHANARMVWSPHPANERHLFDVEPEGLLEDENTHVALIMEIVATRNIAAGDEITMDYGNAWQEAWNEHVADWQEGLAAGEIPEKWPIKALDVMEHHRKNVIKTREELEKEPYPENVMLLAFINYDHESKNKGTIQDPKVWGGPAKGYSPYHQESITEGVVILERQKVEDSDKPMPYTYTVQFPGPREGHKTVVQGVPHEAFVFADAPETSDEFFDGAFRHYIQIPDDVFPQGPWRNIVTYQEDEEVAEE